MVVSTITNFKQTMDTLYLLYPPLIFALYIFTKHILNKIQNLPPSPFLTLPILGHLYLLKKPLHRTLAQVSARYGPVTLLQFGSRPVLIVSSPSAAQECLTKYDVVFANRPRLLAGKYIGYNYTSLAWAPYGDHWRNLRRISSVEILSSHRLQMLSDIRTDEIRSAIRRLRRNPAEQTVEMKVVFFELMLNVMMRMIAGKRYYGEEVADLEAAGRFREIVTETFRLAGATNLEDFVQILRWGGVRGSEKKLRDLQEKRDEFMQELVEEQRNRIGSFDSGDDEMRERKKTMIEVMLTLQGKEPEYYTDEIIRGLMLVLLSAGTDTSAGSMEWALSLLLNNSEVLKKAQIEIDSNIGHHRMINESDMASLPYLRCIINETMRMYPVGPLLVPHESSEETMIGSFRIPRGTMLLVNLWAIQNDPMVWADSRKFMPERFEGQDGIKDGFKFFPFGYGRRGCPGEGLAMRMVGLALGALIQCFDWERVNKDMIDMTEGAGLTMPKARPLMVKCRPRPVMANLLSQL